jgi:hypothetical protein
MSGWSLPVASIPAGEQSEQPLSFRVRFRGTLSAGWFATLQDVTLSSSRVGNATETTLAGQVPDEAALIGLVNLLYELGCTLISVETRGQGAPSDLPDTLHT